MSYNILITGDSGVGKTVFVQQSLGKLGKVYPVTIGIEVSTLPIHNHTLHVYDLAGNHNLVKIHQNIYQKANVIMIMHNSKIPSSSENIKLWKKYAQLYNNKIPILIYNNHYKPSSDVWKYIIDLITLQ